MNQENNHCVACRRPPQPGRPFCRLHDPNTPRCHGLTIIHDGTSRVRAGPRCRAVTKADDYDYCCAAHDMTIPYISPDQFRIDGLRANRLDTIVELYGGRDTYDGSNLLTNKLYELDHITEGQMFAFGLHNIDRNEEEKELIASVIRDDVANENGNLGVTWKATNRIKGQAVKRFLDDRLTGHYDSNTSFTDYMFAAYTPLHNANGNRTWERLTRKNTMMIRKEMGRAVKFCQRKLANEGESPELEDMSAQLQELFVMMEL